MQTRLDSNPRYKHFINARDRTLEKLLANAQAETSDILNQSLQRVESLITSRYSQIPEQDFFTLNATRILKLLEEQIDNEFAHTAMQIFLRQTKMRRRAFILSALGEMEAIGRTLDKPVKIELNQETLAKATFDKTGEDLIRRIRLGLNRLKRKIMDAIELSRVQELPLRDCLKKVIEKFPKPKVMKRAPNELSRITEADAPGSAFDARRRVASIDFMSEDEWADVVQDYKSVYLPRSRFYNEPIEWREDGKEYIAYSWEIEENTTHDFVAQVRHGQTEAMKQARASGIGAFVWIAVIDDKTDECCSVRDGLTDKEIAEKMASGAIDSDKCDAVVPPAHFNCRCRIAPMANEKDMPEVPEFNYEGFQEWLDQ